MRLHHYTSRAQRLPWILGSGFLRVDESNVGSPNHGPLYAGPRGKHVGPDVVWLTDLPTVHGTGTSIEKGDSRVTVEVPDDDVRRWPEWAREQGIDRGWYDRLAALCDPPRTFLVEREVPWSEWVVVEGELMYPGTGRNDPCPCGSGHKFKACHDGEREILWTPADGITVVYSREEVDKVGGSWTHLAGLDD